MGYKVLFFSFIVVAMMSLCTGRTKLSSNSRCNLPRLEGPCRSLFPKYYYSTRFGKCTKFSYSGCGGNSNNFETKKDCEERCTDNVSRTKLSSNSRCNLPRLEGPCRSLFPKYYYSTRFGKCTKFNYSGCGGNSNNFATKKDCEERCTDNVLRTKLSSNSRCNLPRLEGRCRALFPKYSYSTRFGKCTKFNYSGCGGNSNNFATKKDCEERCY